MSSESNMVKEWTKEESVLFEISSSQIAIYLEGKLRFYCVSKTLVAKIMKKATLKAVVSWLKEKQIGQSIDCKEEGTYFSDNAIIKSDDMITIQTSAQWELAFIYSTVTDLARFRGLSTSRPFSFEI